MQKYKLFQTTAQNSKKTAWNKKKLSFPDLLHYFTTFWGTALHDLAEKPVEPALRGLIAIQKDTPNKGADQQNGFQPILDRQYHDTYKDEQHGPQSPHEGPTELEDIEGG